MVSIEHSKCRPCTHCLPVDCCIRAVSGDPFWLHQPRAVHSLFPFLVALPIALSAGDGHSAC